MIDVDRALRGMWNSEGELIVPSKKVQGKRPLPDSVLDIKCDTELTGNFVVPMSVHCQEISVGF